MRQPKIGAGDTSVDGQGLVVCRLLTLAEPGTECVADGRHAEGHVEVLAALAHEEGVQRGGRQLLPCPLGLGRHHLHDRHKLVLGEEVRHCRKRTT